MSKKMIDLAILTGAVAAIEMSEHPRFRSLRPKTKLNKKQIRHNRLKKVSRKAFKKARKTNRRK